MIEEMEVIVGHVPMSVVFRVELDSESSEVHNIQIVNIFVGDRSPVMYDPNLWASVEAYVRDSYEIT
jgi:hypothetical protein